MTDSNWSMSASSEDDEDAHFFQSNVREGSVYYEKFLKDDFGTDVWADHIPQFMNLGLNNINDIRSSFANGTMLNALHLPCTVPDRVMVLNRDTNQYEVMRYVEMSNGSVITSKSEVNLSDSTMNVTMASSSTSAHFQNNSFNPLASPKRIPHVNGDMKHTHKPKLIPLEPVDLVDLIDKLSDRRKKKPEPEELMELPLPSLYYEIEWNGKEWVSAKKPKCDKSHGFKPSMSYQRERRDRVNRHLDRRDPRLTKDLFSSPKRVEAQTSKDDKHHNMKNIFGFDSDTSMAHSSSPSMSPSFSAFNSKSDFAANSTVLPGNCSDSGSTSSDINLSDSETFEEKTKRKLRSRNRKNKKRNDKFEDQENEKVPPLVIKLPKPVNSIDQGYSSKKPPQKMVYASIVPAKLLKAPKEIHELRNEVLAAMQGEFPYDEDLTNKDGKGTIEKCDEAVPTQFTETINQTDNIAANATDCMEMDIDGDAVAETSANANEQPKENETKTKDDSHELDDISDDEMMNEQPKIVSHGNLTDLEDVSTDECNDIHAHNLDNLSVDDKILSEAVKEIFGVDENVEHQPNTTDNSDIEKTLALFDDVGSEDIDRFVAAKSNEESIATPNPPDSNDRHELIKILDPNIIEEQNGNVVVPADSGPENMETEQEADSFDVPEIGATADIGAITSDIQSDQLNLDEFNDVNSFGRPKNLFPNLADETHRIKITIGLHEYEMAENELEKQLRKDDNDEEHGKSSISIDEPTVEKCEKADQKPETIVEKDEYDEMHVDFNSIETSEDDLEYDYPILSENDVELKSNTDSRVTQTNSKCTMCPYKDLVGWRKLTKHYIRKHPGTEIAHSRLAERFNLDQIIVNPVSSTINDRMLIKSICLFCDQFYGLNSSKWEKHFVSHTGECPFECRKCGSKLFDDLHKRCNSKNNIAISGPHEFKENKLCGYVCKICDFVQLNKKNIFNHIESQHQAMPTEESIIEIFLINVTETETSSNSSNTDIIFLEVFSDDEDEKPLKNRSVSTEKSPLKVPDEAIDLTLDSDADVD